MKWCVYGIEEFDISWNVTLSSSHYLDCSVLLLPTALPPRPPCHPGLKSPKPSGFYYQNTWHSLSCSGRTFPTADSILGCLAGRVVHMIGDSTLRQWWEYLRDTVPCEWWRGEARDTRALRKEDVNREGFAEGNPRVWWRVGQDAASLWKASEGRSQFWEGAVTTIEMPSWFHRKLCPEFNDIAEPFK
jgi:hypothetical protein